MNSKIDNQTVTNRELDECLAKLESSLTPDQKFVISIRAFLRTLPDSVFSNTPKFSDDTADNIFFLFATSIQFFYRVLDPEKFRYFERDVPFDTIENDHSWAMGHLSQLLSGIDIFQNRSMSSCIRHSLNPLGRLAFEQLSRDARALENEDDHTLCLTSPLWLGTSVVQMDQVRSEWRTKKHLLIQSDSEWSEIIAWYENRLDGSSVSNFEIMKWKIFFSSYFYYSEELDPLLNYLSGIDNNFTLFEDFHGWMHWLGGIESELTVPIVFRWLLRLLIAEKNILLSTDRAPALVLSILHALSAGFLYREINRGQNGAVFQTIMENLQFSRQEQNLIENEYISDVLGMLDFLTNSFVEPDWFWENSNDLYQMHLIAIRLGVLGESINELHAEALLIEFNELSLNYESYRLWPEKSFQDVKKTWGKTDESLSNAAPEWKVWSEWISERIIGRPFDYSIEIGNPVLGEYGRISFPTEDYRDPAVVNPKIKALFDANSSNNRIEEFEELDIEHLIEQFPISEDVVLSVDGEFDFKKIPFKQRYSENLLRISRSLQATIEKNGLGPGSEEASFIRDEILTNFDSPQKTYDDCHFIANNLSALQKNDVIPDQLSVRRLVNAIIITAKDIEANEPLVRDVLFKRNALSTQINKDVLEEKLDLLKASVEELKPSLSKDAENSIVDDLLTLTGKKDKAKAAYRLMGRALQMYKSLVEAGGASAVFGRASVVSETIKVSLLKAQPHLETIISILNNVFH